ncbi:hypothetical protein O7598_31120 [Micromonospora sp. WMMC241]|uniref:hypothetical protein n=1 Tax=Micromonospora sp. WMMC241 TaxID=3015159 RepID=UPI0022B7260E|nr:hypothetical protein [Micromonospora sp. WMMC241]MCZ7440796.1 hypothetical protein [Micromonospora sp. WMMC241]MCZ7440877.1 hypothetical protein [Micromonospora sp. WMMC241]
MTDIVLAREYRAAEQPAGEIVLVTAPAHVHTRWPSPAQMTANGAVTAMALLGAGLVAGGFTGRVAVDSPVTYGAMVVLFVLALVALRARRRAEGGQP